MPYLQEMLVDKCIEELERKKKQSEDFRNCYDQYFSFNRLSTFS